MRMNISSVVYTDTDDSQVTLLGQLLLVAKRGLRVEWVKYISSDKHVHVKYIVMVYIAVVTRNVQSCDTVKNYIVILVVMLSILG